MKPLLVLMLVLLTAALAAVPGYLSFELQLTNVIVYPPWVDVLGVLTITNNGTADWVFQSIYAHMAEIHIDGQHGSIGWYEWPFYLCLPPQQSVSIDVMGENSNLAPGVHTAQAYLFYSPSSQEAVGNIVNFSSDQVLDEVADLNWSLQTNEIGADYVSATLTAANPSDYLWKRQFPYFTVTSLGFDGQIPQNPGDPDPHFEVIGPHNHKTFDLLHFADAPFTNGYHSVQAYAYVSDSWPVAVGEPVVFQVGSALEDESAPALTLQISPNPLRDDSLLTLFSPQKTSLELSVYNLRGQRILSKTGLQARSGRNDWPLNSILEERLPAGIHLLKVSGSGFSTTVKVFQVN